MTQSGGNDRDRFAGPRTADAATAPERRAARRRRRLPRTEISLNPDGRGVTGLEVWLWWEPVDTITTAVTLAGLTGTVTARDPAFRAQIKRIIDEDSELRERLAK